MEDFQDTLTVPSLDNDSWLGSEVGPYKILERLGQGGMGTVYRAHDGALRRDVAVKILHENLTTDPDAVSRFIEEARTSARLDHPNILGVLMIGEIRNRRWVAMPLMTGGSLADRVAREGPLPVAEALTITRELAGALGAAHAEGVTHRDVKPENVMSDKSDRLRLSDFGMAAMRDGIESRVADNGEILGTPYTMAPEQCSARGGGKRSDVYSLGITLFHMLTGTWPFTGETSVAVLLKHVCEELPEEPLRAVGVNDNTIALIRRMTAKDPADRQKTMAEVSADINQLLTAGRLPKRRVRRRGPRRLPIRTVLRMLIVVLAAGVTWAAWKGVFIREDPVDPAPEKIVLAAPEQRIEDLLDDSYSYRTILIKGELGNEKHWLDVLSALLALEGIFNEIALIDPTRADLVDRSQELEDLKFEWITRISGAIVNPLVEEARFELSLEELKRLPEPLLQLPRVAQYAFEVVCRHTDALLAEGSKASVIEAGDWLDRAWGLDVPSIKVAELVDREQRWRRAMTDLGNDIVGDSRRTRWYRGWQRLRELKRREKFLEAGYRVDVLIADLVTLADAVEVTVNQLNREKEILGGLQEARVSFDAALSLGDFAMAQQSWLNWRELAPTPSSRLAWRRLESARLLQQGAERVAAGDVEGSLETVQSLIRIEPRHPELADLRTKLEELARRRHQETMVDRGLLAYLEFSRGHYRAGIELLSDDIPPEFRSRADVSQRAQRAYDQGQWDRVIDSAGPWRGALDLDGRTRWVVAQSLRSRAQIHLQANRHEEAWRDVGEAIDWCGELWTLIALKQSVRSSWTQVALHDMSTAETKSDTHLISGKPEQALTILATQQDRLGHEVLDSSPEVQAMAASLHRRHDDLVTYLKDVKQAKISIDTGLWKEAEEALEAAQSWQDIPQVTGALRRRLDHGRALQELERSELSPANRLRLSWTAWHNRSGESRTELDRHRAVRLAVADQIVMVARVSRDAVAAVLNRRELAAARRSFDDIQTRLMNVSSDLVRDPSLQPSDTFFQEQGWWATFGKKLERSERAERLATESLKKYRSHLAMAAAHERELALDKALDALKNARLHAGHLNEGQLDTLDRRIKGLETRLANAHSTVVERGKERQRIEALKLISGAFDKEFQAGRWLAAKVKFDEFKKEAGPDDAMLLPGKRSLAEWQALLTERIDNAMQWQTVNKQIAKLAPGKQIEALNRFKRVHAGNFYVRTGVVQTAIDKARQRREGWRGDLRAAVRRDVNRLLVSGDVPGAQQIVLSGLGKLKDDRDLSHLLSTLLDSDRIIFAGGSYPVGSEPGEGVGKHESPVWRRLVPHFALGRHEVTNVQYARFVSETGARVPTSWGGKTLPTDMALQPVRGVSWIEASAYARWVGARLPNEFEWEWAARSGGELQRWPWGNAEDKTRARIDARNSVPAGIFDYPKGRSPQGLSHLAGNVAEWTSSSFKTYPKAGMFGKWKLPTEIISGAKVVRGGSLFNGLNGCRTTARVGRLPDVRRHDLGFRLCWNVENDHVVVIPKKDKIK